MKFLGIDYGSKRVGLALSDDESNLAFPHTVLENGKNLVSKIKEIIELEKVSGIVLGESSNFQGEPNKIMPAIKNFAEDLKKETGLLVFFEPEFMTSVQAERFTGKNEKSDASAAALILQSFLDRKKNGV